MSRTGRYKVLLVAGLAVMSLGLWLMTGIRADTQLPVLWSWMFISGLGIGPTLSVFTIVVQNAVPVRSLGVATSNLTFFRQVGGSVGLALLGTVFGNRLTEEVPTQLVAAGVPRQFVDQFASSSAGGNATDLVVVGQDLGTTILNAVPEAFRSVVEPLIPNIVFGIHQAFSLAVSQVFLVGVGTTLGALVFTVVMRELPLRRGYGPQHEAEHEAVAAGKAPTKPATALD